MRPQRKEQKESENSYLPPSFLPNSPQTAHKNLKTKKQRYPLTKYQRNNCRNWSTVTKKSPTKQKTLTPAKITAKNKETTYRRNNSKSADENRPEYRRENSEMVAKGKRKRRNRRSENGDENKGKMSVLILTQVPYKNSTEE
ncbi:12127_t:CDS:2 [Ambispora leptoticha]|uniref:12127_t:CDS:1 n=1 Tax=Ambispora leptoticha TaxID=144679 RepID=A0A9N9G9E6_9GLOM|nr:12127_t:CDS:2 [Ambispora leptoticha]